MLRWLREKAEKYRDLSREAMRDGNELLSKRYDGLASGFLITTKHLRSKRRNTCSSFKSTQV